MAEKATPREVVFIPCFGAGITRFPNLHSRLEAEDVRVHGITLDWYDRTATMEDHAASTSEQVEALSVSDKAILLGHSVGAILAGLEARRRAYGRLVVCSVSPMGRVADTTKRTLTLAARTELEFGYQHRCG